MCRYILLALILACIFLAYRVFDLGVTLDYSSQELLRIRSDIEIIKSYQGEKCDVVRDKIDGVSIFQKENLIVIEGVSFICEEQHQTLSVVDY